jgi:UDP-N-acetylmuramoylalanine--D-glutamate ligase
MVLFPADSPGAAAIAKEGKGRKLPFSAEDAPVAIEETHLLGLHNLSNIAAAYRVACELDIPEEISVAAIKAFRGLPHRLQSLGIHHGIEWVDDAISTTPESTIAALDALGERVATIILGGQDRGNDFSALGRRIAKSSIQTIILFPGSGPRIRKAIEATGATVHFFETESMEEAIAVAKQHTRYEIRDTRYAPIVLLSTASPSYNMFKNFEEKGEAFRRCVESPL